MKFDIKSCTAHVAVDTPPLTAIPYTKPGPPASLPSFQASLIYHSRLKSESPTTLSWNPSRLPTFSDFLHPNTSKSPRTLFVPRAVPMSGYQNYSSGGNGQYPSYNSQSTVAYGAAIPQYTQSQINAYYQQYHCLPPHPHHVIPDYYTSPVTVPSAHDPASSSPDYGSQYGGSATRVSEPNMLAPPLDEETLRQRRSTRTGRRSRSNSNTRTWTCDLDQCTSTANFTRLADLQRHQATVHAASMPDFPCTEPGCSRVADKGFTRKDHLVEHLRNFHHLPIPKRRPGERSAGLPPY